MDAGVYFMSLKRISPHPLPKLEKFLKNFKDIFERSDTFSSAERYVVGLLSDIPSKTCSKMGAAIEGTSGQSLQEFLTNSTWNHDELNHLRIKYMIENATKEDGIIVVDDTGFEKKGKSSVGVSRQYSGTLGKVGNCQIAVSLQYADSRYTWPINARVYLPQAWIDDKDRLKKARVPDDIKFKTKIEIALDLLKQATEVGVNCKAVVADAGYGSNPNFLEGLEEQKLFYAVQVRRDFTVRLKGSNENIISEEKLESLPPVPEIGQLAESIPDEQWETLSWKQGSKGALKKQFVFLKGCWETIKYGKVGSSNWIILERSISGEDIEFKYCISSLPEDTPKIQLIQYLHRRETIERFYQDAKTDLGLDQYEGRMWHGFHRHFIMVMLAYSFLILRCREYDQKVTEYEVVAESEHSPPSLDKGKGVFSPSSILG